MRTLRKLRLRCRSLFNRSKVEEELESELREHFEREVERRTEFGISSEEARQQAALELWNKEVIKEECRDARGTGVLENFARDLRYSLRVLARNPSFCLAAVLTIALGIATATTLFSLVESQLWRPLPFREPEKLVVVWERNLKQAWQQTSVSAANFADWRRRAHTFENMAAMQWPTRRRLVANRHAERPLVAAISSGFFETLGTAPEAGSTFSMQNEEPGNQAEAIVGAALARRVFGSDQNALGKSIELDDQRYAIAGILPPAFRLDILRTPEVFVPLAIGLGQPRNKRELAVFARLRAGVSRGAASADLESIAHALAVEHPESNRNFSVLVEDPLDSFTPASTRTWLLLLLAFALFVLLIACFNVATLQLMRSAVRSREFALRKALGASRSAMIRQAIAESAWLVVSGGAIGIALAVSGLQGLRALGLMNMLTRETELSINLWSVGFVVVMSTVATVFFGLAPELLLAKEDLESSLRGSGRSSSHNQGLRRRLAIFSIAEITLAFLAVFGTGLFAGSYRSLEQVHLGFNPAHISAMQVSLSGNRYSDPLAVRTFYRKALERAAAVPGIQQAELSSSLPLSGGIDVNFVRADQPRPPRGQESFSFVRSVTNGYFQLLGIPIVKGRSLDHNDIASGPRVAVINQNLAMHLFAGENPIGKQLLLLAGDEPSISEGRVEIVGVAANVRDVGLNEVPFDDLYLPASQVVPHTMYVVVRTTASASVGPILRQKIQALDPGQFVAELRPLRSYVTEQMRGALFNFSVVGIFAGLCLILTVVALFGTLSFSVVQQRRDIGVRIAVGARPLDVLKLIVWQTCCLVALGSTIGLAIALVAGKLCGERLFMVPHQHDGILYGVTMRDPLSLTFAVLTLLLVASASALLPALRATRIDPNIALRCE